MSMSMRVSMNGIVVAAVGSLLSLTALSTIANAGKVSSSVKVHVSNTCNYCGVSCIVLY